jgi:hypothetical protein
MIAYASRTGTRRNLAALRAAGWHLLVSAAGCLRHEGFPYALDNGAWSAFQHGTAFDAKRFERAVELLAAGAEWVVAPDIVAGGRESLELSLAWLPRLLDRTTRVLLAVQNGIQETDIASLLGPRVGIFVGGDTEWKLATMDQWAALARARGCWCHIARVNTVRRVLRCQVAGAHSFDGTSVSRFACTITELDNARRSPALPWH